MMNEIPLDDPRPEWLITNQAEHSQVGMISVDGRTIPYTIIKHGIIRPELPYAVGFDHPDELFISEDVPPIDRAPILAHEVREKTKFLIEPEENRCAQALVVEFAEIEKSRTRKEYKKYVKRRAEYFSALSQYYEDPQRRDTVSEKLRYGLSLSSGLANHIAGSL